MGGIASGIMSTMAAIVIVPTAREWPDIAGEDPSTTLHNPRMQERDFVMRPLEEISRNGKGGLTTKHNASPIPPRLHTSTLTTRNGWHAYP